MSKIFFSLVTVILLVGCQVNTSQQLTTAYDDHYLSFSIVTQEFGYATEAIDTINHIIDIHEQYNVPLDVIVDDASMQLYAAEAPAVIERLKNSPVVAVSYHTRPPTPYYENFDFAGLQKLSSTDLYDQILAYEEHDTNLVTGQPGDGAGGYQFVKDQIGYAPIMVGMITEPEFAPTLLKIYSEKGAQFVIEHRSEPIEPNQYRDHLMVRPETIPLIFTEYLEDSPEQLITDQFANAPTVTGPVFMAIKTHDNDFFATQSAWLSVYLHQAGRGIPKPPFNLSVAAETRSLLSTEEQAARWQHYEDLVAYASDQSTAFTLLNAKKLVDVVGSENSTPAANDTVIYATVVSHNEEPSARTPDYEADEDLFWLNRTAVINFAEAVTTSGAAYSWQSDWNFLRAIAKYDHGTADTDNKNLVQYLHDDLGVEIDPHAHESTYNYADVAYLIQSLGVAPSHVVGGFLVDPPERSKLEYLREPLTSTINPSYTWQAAILWGGGSPNHVSDDNVSGIWRPRDTAHYLTDDISGSLPDIGGYTSSWEGLDDLLAKQAAGELEPGLYTVAIMVNQSEMLDAATVTDTVAAINSYADAVKRGDLVWATLQDTVAVWEKDFNSQPIIYTAAASIPTHGEELNTAAAEDKGNCGNGVCEPLEQRLDVCSADCH